MEILFIFIALMLCAYNQYKIETLKQKIQILSIENLSLKKVMCEEGLIPKEFVK